MKRGAKNKGRVILVGAGPGDPGLLTLRGRDALASCDAVLYDEIVHPDVLRWIPASAQRYYVGKKSGHHAVPQDRINRQLAALARSGKQVIRLKGGDPYLFGRGAEEAAFLSARRIDFEVLPGVSSPSGCAAYAGIPLTERTASSRVAFVTAHHADSAAKALPWKALRASVDTLVIFMGLKRLDLICNELLRAGYARTTPAAAVSRGTWPAQRCVAGTLQTLADRVKKNGLQAPALVFVGNVVRLRDADRLNWYERRPLFGKRIVITRARSQASSFKEKLTTMGAQVLELPTIRIQPPSSYRAMDRQIKCLETYDWVIFSSVNAVESFFGRLSVYHRLDARRLTSNRVAAVGEATREALERHGITADLTPETYTSKALASALIQRGIRGARLLLVRPQVAPPEFAASLHGAGAAVTEVAAYRTACPKAEIRFTYQEVARGGADAVVFTSSSTAEHLHAALGAQKFKTFVNKTRVFSIGPQTSSSLRRLGARVYRQSRTATIPGLIRSLEESL